MLTLTATAEERILKIAQYPEFLRINLEGGGCHGYSYKFIIDKVLNEDDIKYEKNGRVLAVIKKAYLEKIPSSTIEFVSTIGAAYFVLKSESFGTTCGCGTSFSLKKNNDT